MPGLYVGMVLIAIGDAFFSPNLLAQFGHAYVGKYQLADAGIAILYVMVNLGSFLGVALMGWMFEDILWQGFLANGIISLLAAGLLLALPKQANNLQQDSAHKTDLAPIILI